MTFRPRAIVGGKLAVARRLVIRVSIRAEDRYARAAPSAEWPFIPPAERERGSSASRRR